MKVNPQLYLNRNPRNIPTNSAVCAKNMMLDINEEYLVTDNGIGIMMNDLKALGGEIKLCMAVIDGFLIIAVNKTWFYNENTNLLTELSGFRRYYPEADGELVGTYYYNVANELIVGIGEKSATATKQLATLNVSRAIASVTESWKYNVISPKVPIAKFEAKVVKGNAKKGTYHFFIRYNLNAVESTKWMHLGYPVTLHSMGKAVNLFSIYETTHGMVSQACDVYSDDSNQSDCGIEVDMRCSFHAPYVSYDIAVIIDAVDGVSSYKMCTNKFGIVDDDGFKFSANNLEPIAIEDLIDTPFKIEDVGQVCAHGNRLYVADYSETDVNPALAGYAATVKLKITSTDVNVDKDRTVATGSNKTYVNPNISLKNRLINKTLIPNDPYQFFIHYVDENGSHTNGYPIISFDSASGFTKIGSDNTVVFTSASVTGGGYATFPAYSISVTNVTIPAGYIAWFISYAKPESFVLATALASRDGFCNSDTDTTAYDYACLYTNRMFMDDRPDITDSYLKLLYNSLQTKKLTPTSGTLDDKGKCFYNRNIGKVTTSLLTTNPTIKTAVYNPYGIGDTVNTTANIYCTLSAAVKVCAKSFPNQVHSVVQIIKEDGAVYKNTTKTLISTGYVSTNTGATVTNIPNGAMPGFITWDIIYAFNEDGCIIHDVDGWNLDYDGSGNACVPLNNDGELLSQGNDHSVAVVGFISYSLVLFETKTANLQFKTFMANKNQPSRDQKRMFCKAVTPMQAIDMVRYNKTKDFYYPFAYTNYVANDLLKPMTTFKRTIRRSRPIQDESISNSWRKFMANDYKVIAESKGDITNLVSLGALLLVHCEHSLFVFNTDSSLKTENKDIQLQMPDVFDIGYTEMFTSQKGYAGLQDKRYSNISGDFGYIFYDKSSLCIYRYDDNKIIPMSDDISWIVHYLKPDSIIMTFDNVPDRILMCMIVAGTPKLTVSYSTKLNVFVSLHDYGFTDAWYTKNIAYIMRDSIIARVRKDAITSNYETFAIDDMYPTYKDGNNHMSYIDVICNTLNNGQPIEQALILESVRYVASKYRIDISSDNICDIATIEPYPADFIKAYSDTVGNMVEVDVSTGSEGLNPFKDVDKWKKPMYDKGWFTFNNFRFEPIEGSAISNNMRYIYGKYIVIRFIFKFYADNVKTRLESLQLNYKPYI